MLVLFSLNVTVTEAGGSGFVTETCGHARMPESQLHGWSDNLNAVIAPVSAQGEVCFYSQAPVHLLADVKRMVRIGFFVSRYNAVRVFDTRP